MYLVINNSLTDTVNLSLPCEAEGYLLSGNGDIRSQTVCLNGEALSLSESGELPELSGEKLSAGVVEISPL